MLHKQTGCYLTLLKPIPNTIGDTLTFIDVGFCFSFNWTTMIIGIQKI